MENIESRSHFEHVHGYQSERSNNAPRGKLVQYCIDFILFLKI